MFERQYFIVAPNFHGATLLSRLLDCHPKVVSLGDTYPSNRSGEVCGCGERVNQCPFWQRVAAVIGSERYRSHPHWLPYYPAILGGDKDRLLYNLLSLRALGKMIPGDRQESFVTDFTAFTKAVHAYGGRPEARIFVDGVKSISRVRALAACGVPIAGVIHLHRNPGDYIQSAMKNHGYNRLAFVRKLANYRLFHNRARRLDREFPYLCVNYEDLAKEPDATLHRVFQFIGVEPLSLSELIAEGRQRPWHYLGNASLFHFDGTIHPRSHTQTPLERLVTRLIAGPYDARHLHLAQSQA